MGRGGGLSRILQACRGDFWDTHRAVQAAGWAERTAEHLAGTESEMKRKRGGSAQTARTVVQCVRECVCALVHVSV